MWGTGAKERVGVAKGHFNLGELGGGQVTWGAGMKLDRSVIHASKATTPHR
jgi:hypothetical protein